jgi:hypothetical protein
VRIEKKKNKKQHDRNGEKSNSSSLFLFFSPSPFLSFHPNAFRFVGLGESSTMIEFPLPY